MRAKRRPQIDSESDFLGLNRRPTFGLKIALPVVSAFEIYRFLSWVLAIP